MGGLGVGRGRGYGILSGFLRMFSPWRPLRWFFDAMFVFVGLFSFRISQDRCGFFLRIFMDPFQDSLRGWKKILRVFSRFLRIFKDL